MNINATLIGQAIWFAVFIWITMKYVWPPLQQAMAERQKQIALAKARGLDHIAADQEAQREAKRAARAEQIAKSNAGAGEIIHSDG